MVEVQKGLPRIHFLFGVVLLSACLGAFLGAAENAENIIKNPGFENPESEYAWSKNNWAKNEVSFELDPVNPRSGKFSQKIAFTKVLGHPQVQLQQKIVVKLNAAFRVSVWMRGRENCKPIEVLFRKIGTPYTTWHKFEAQIDNEWKEYSFVAVLSANTVSEDTAFFFNINQDDTIWIDDVSVVELPPQDASAPRSGNQCANGSFEVGTDYWYATFRESGGYSRSGIATERNIAANLVSAERKDAPAGKRVLAFDIFESCSVMLTTAYFPLRYGFPASLGLKLKGPSGKKFTAKIGSGKTPNVTEVAKKDFVLSGDGWNAFSLSFTPPPSSTGRYFLELYSQDPGAYELDVVTIAEGESPSSYAPNPAVIGTTPGDASHPGNIYFPGEKISVWVNAETVPETKGLTLYARVVNVWNEEVSRFSTQVSLSEGFGRANVSLPSSLTGGFKCELFSKQDLSGDPAAEFMYSVVPKLKSPKESKDAFFGGTFYLTPYNLTLAERGGFRSLRLYSSHVTAWQIVEPVQGTYSFDTNGVVRAHELGFKMLGALNTTPAWQADSDPQGEKQTGPWFCYAPKDMDEWKRYVKDVVAAYPWVKDWEIWNEPDGRYLLIKKGQDKETVLTNLFYATRQVVGENRLPIRLFGGAVSSVNDPLLGKIVSSKAHEQLDGLSFHFYFEDSSMDEMPSPSMIHRVTNLLTLKSFSKQGLEVWDTEGGVFLQGGISWLKTSFIPPGSGLSIRDTASALVRTAISAKAAGCLRHFHYIDTAHPAGRTSYRDECTGLIDVNGVPHPALAAHAAMVSFLDEAVPKGFTEEKIGESRVFIGHFMKNGTPVDAVWSRVPTTLGSVKALKVEGRKVFDMMGNPLNASKDTPVAICPLYLVQK
ncbi:MAG: hypothetical protein JNM63_11825 [Spirochaetia bacterium]|nr:hypothetical protein [Spirochaetia bacterium]